MTGIATAVTGGKGWGAGRRGGSEGGTDSEVRISKESCPGEENFPGAPAGTRTHYLRSRVRHSTSELISLEITHVNFAGTWSNATTGPQGRVPQSCECL